MKGKTLAYQPTRDEGNALHFLALALRPEWAKNPPGQIWQSKISNSTFPHAESFEHCLNALVDYCKAQRQGKPKYTHPTLFPDEGDHWKQTVPRDLEKNPREPCPDHKFDRNNRWNCIGCKSEIKAGQRPPEYLGKPYERPENAA